MKLQYNGFVSDKLHQFKSAFCIPGQLRADLFTLLWSYRSDAFNFLGLLDCAGDEGASALPGALRDTIVNNLYHIQCIYMNWYVRGKVEKKITGIYRYWYVPFVSDLV